MTITIQNPHLTARDAADRFAAKHFAEPRTVGDWMPNADNSGEAHFRLAGGVKTYRVHVTPSHDGWEITDEWIA